MTTRWFEMGRQEVIEKLGTCAEKGLDEQSAKERLEQYGPNKLASAGRTPPWLMFVNQFKDFMVLILLAATLVSGLLGEWADAITIMIIVVINAS
ncbi:hypothetical protein N752_14740 [Desulforamulus aquiferis]|nr:hypothetical protein N752_14740 [Desulforamulus aquiferis]